MLVIRLARVGRKKQAMFRVVVADKRRTPTGRFVAQIGHYDPHAKEFVVDQDQLQLYLKDGAQPSSTMVKLLKRAKIKLPAWAEANLVVKNKPPKAKKSNSEEAVVPAAKTAESPDAAAETAPASTDTAAAEPASEALPAETSTELPDTEEAVEAEKPAPRAPAKPKAKEAA